MDCLADTITFTKGVECVQSSFWPLGLWVAMIDVADVEGAVSRCEHVHSVLLHVYSAESIGESIFYDVGVNLI